jgi:hypothetical protein
MTELSMQTAELLPAREALSYNTINNFITNWAYADSDFDDATAAANQTAVVLNNLDD